MSGKGYEENKRHKGYQNTDSSFGSAGRTYQDQKTLQYYDY